jgi:hypothetical protein
MRFLVPLLIATAAFAIQPDYFPLVTGNQWTYRSTPSGQSFTVEVSGVEQAGGKTYSVVEGLPSGTLLLRMSEDGTLYAYNRDTKSEAVWVDFHSDGASFPVTTDPCVSSGRLRSRAAKVSVPIGQFDNALQIEYTPGKCADAGRTSELYLPYIGLLQRTETSIAGPVVFDLIYARLNDGLTIITAPEQSISGSIDKNVYAPGEMAITRITVRNTRPEPLVLTFPTGQRYDVVVRNAAGDVIYQWARGRLFTQVFGTIAIKGDKTWVVSFPAPESPGGYTVEVSLATEDRAYHAQLALTVK